MSLLSVGLGKLGKGAKKLVTNPVKWAENAGRSVGKAASDAAPVVGLIPGVGTLYGATIGGLGSVMAGNNARTSFGKAVTGGLSGFANKHLLGGQGFKGIPGALHLGGSAPSSLAGATAAGTPDALATTAAGAVDAGNAAATTANTVGSHGFLGSLGDAARGVGGFIKDNPTAVAAGLQGAGQLATSGSENRLRDAEARQRDAEALNLEQKADETDYDFGQRKRREELMRPIWSALSSGVTNNVPQVAANPYAGR